MLRAVRMLIHDPVRRHARTVGPTATADVMGKHWLIKGSLGGCPRLCWACGDASPKNVRCEVTDACKVHATVKTCYIIHHVCSLRDREALGICRKVRFLGQNPKIGYQTFNDLLT